MAVPKKRTSKSKRNSRKSQWYKLASVAKQKAVSLAKSIINGKSTIFVFNSDDLNGWWTGKVGDRVGKFPRSCVMLD